MFFRLQQAMANSKNKKRNVDRKCQLRERYRTTLGEAQHNWRLAARWPPEALANYALTRRFFQRSQDDREVTFLSLNVFRLSPL
jgi:hypothetical protein